MDSHMTAQPEYRDIGETSSMPGSVGFTVGSFHAKDVPVGTEIYILLVQDAGAKVEYLRAGEATEMPGTNGGFTLAVFKASDVRVGAKLYVKAAA